MRNRTRAALAAMLLSVVLCSAAHATEGPPVKVRLLGEPRGVAAGETFKGALEITSGVDATLGDFRLEGDTWRVISLDVAPQVSLTGDRRLEIPFEVVAVDDPDDLYFRFSFGGRVLTKALNLGEGHAARMTAPSPTVKMWDDTAPLDTSGLPKPAPADDGRHIGVGDDPDPEDGPVADKRTITVSGRFEYQRSDGVTIGADGVTVRVYDEDTFSDDLLGSDTTDAFGWFSISISTGDAGEDNPDLYVNFECANSRLEVEDATWEINYRWETGTWDNYGGSALDVGPISPANESQHAAVNILTVLTRSWRWLLNREGFDTPSTDIQWPDGSAGAYYSHVWEEIHVSPEREWHEHTLVHEYMHHWVYKYAVRVPPEYCNGWCDTEVEWWLDDCGHCPWCEETVNTAFSEGFPNGVADIVTRSFAEDYGIAILPPIPGLRSEYETLEGCWEDSDAYHDAYRTEGFFAALIRDIEDAASDDHAHFAGYTDVMALGTAEIFDVVDLDHPTSPTEFLDAFGNRFPEHREQLWETAMNCGYNTDAARPGAATGLTSSSHVVGTPSPDPTVTYTWNRAADDASGIAGYGISITTVPQMPAPVEDIGDVTTYTTAVLPYGTYYFNIRALDRDGNWSDELASFGPITVRAPEPSDLTEYQPAGWQHPLVPRNDATATATSATVSPFLDGNAATTRWNVRGINQGESSTSVGFVSRLYVDGVSRGWAGWNAVVSGNSFYGINMGSISVRGGRHTMSVRYDADDAVAEIDETNNVYGRQWIWTPRPLQSDVPALALAPPGGRDGWDDVENQVRFFNCDGLRTGSPGWWNAAYVRPLNAAEDLDLRLHDVSTGSADGFASSLAYSARPAGYLDAVIANRNTVSADQWDLGVLNNSDATGLYQARHVTNQTVAFGDSLSLTMDADDCLHLYEFYVSVEDTGMVSVTVDADPADGPLTVLWLDENFTTGSLSQATAAAVTSAADGRARLDFAVPDNGYNGLVVYRDPKDGLDPAPYILEIQNTPPDFLPYEAAGWHAPVVPRPAADGTMNLVALPDTLHGNVAGTYLNFAVRNESPSPSPDGMLVRAYADGVYHSGFYWNAFPANTTGVFNWDSAWSFSGGRHTLDMRCDPLQAIEEIHETNNAYGEQYVWSPLNLAAGATATRPTPPERIGGWDNIASGEAIWYNCDGLRIPARLEYWHAIAVMPGAGSDVDVRLHDPLDGVKDGFAANKAYSGWGLESSDFVLVNYNATDAGRQDVGVLALGGDAGYTAEHVTAAYMGVAGDGLDGQEIPAGRILDLHEFYIDPASWPGGVFDVTLVPLGGDVDWGVSLHPADVAFQSKSTMVPGGGAWGNGAGMGEEFSAAISAAGYYCLAVWKAKAADLPVSAAYRLTFGADVIAVPDGVPASTGLASIYPNPFNPMTTIAFDLARPEAVEVAVYNLQGALVRRLVREALPAGRHEVAWDGTDSTGKRTASGVYMVRLKAGATAQMRKLMLVK